MTTPLTSAAARCTIELVARTGSLAVRKPRTMPRALLTTASSLVLWAAAGVFAGAQQMDTSPACAQPNVPAHVLQAAQPTMLPEQTRYGIGGSVRVAVAVAADGQVVAADATPSSIRLFVAPALKVARATRFAPEVRNCVPVAGRFFFDVDYDLPNEIPPQRVDPVAFLPGAWRCAAPDAGARTLIFVRSGKGLVESDGASTMTLEPDRYRIWRLRGDGFSGWAFPWVDETWALSTHLSKDAAAQLRRIDDATFELTAGPPTDPSTELRVTRVTTSERCTRMTAAP